MPLVAGKGMKLKGLRTCTLTSLMLSISSPGPSFPPVLRKFGTYSCYTRSPDTFLPATRPELGTQDPLHAQAVYLSDQDLQQLALRYKVVPWIIEQRQGYLIFIPTGWLHQVCLNFQPAIPTS